MNKLKIAQQNRAQRMKNIKDSVSAYTQDQDKSGFATLPESSDKIEDSVKQGNTIFKNGNGPTM